MTQRSDANIETVKSFLEKAYSGAIPEAARLLDEHVRLEIPGDGPIAGVHNGPDEFFANFARMLETTEGSYTMTEQTDFCASNDRVILLATEQVTRGGHTINFRRAVRYDVTDGMITAVTIYEADPKLAEEAFR
ncbi:hypothetical protein HFP57_07410 [Parasphingopyxis algicola]|uniref:nuclear transport factor 2 family protein n=1 Tax=Parasphingopyxis algicola TaxID=2026624 RepID=UPI0015A0F6BA|nr:nuclear transport factor 2 family protein [Parasphingopyxis algicola]QLC24871.1 hypothetical protein HFP57_07410 [Parasphingopyxis algicola]